MSAACTNTVARMIFKYVYSVSLHTSLPRSTVLLLYIYIRLMRVTFFAWWVVHAVYRKQQRGFPLETDACNSTCIMTQHLIPLAKCVEHAMFASACKFPITSSSFHWRKYGLSSKIKHYYLCSTTCDNAVGHRVWVGGQEAFQFCLIEPQPDSLLKWSGVMLAGETTLLTAWIPKDKIAEVVIIILSFRETTVLDSNVV